MKCGMCDSELIAMDIVNVTRNDNWYEVEFYCPYCKHSITICDYLENFSQSIINFIDIYNKVNEVCVW